MIDGLIEYVLHDLSEAREAAVDEHLFTCDACSAEVLRLQDLVRGIEALVHASAIGFPVTPLLEAKLRAAGLITRTYVVSPSQIVPCRVDANDRFVLTRLVADVGSATRVDVEVSGQLREDVPFDRAGSVSYVATGERLRQLPSMRVAIRVVVDRAPAGEYALDHTAFAP